MSDYKNHPNLSSLDDKRLLSHHLEIVSLLDLNGLPYEYTYQPAESPKHNNSIAYYVDIEGEIYCGFIVNDASKGFIGAIFKNEKYNYLIKEGFSDEFIENEGKYMCVGDTPTTFFLMLCYRILHNLEIFE